MTKLEIIYDVKEYLKAYSDDAEISNEYILYRYNVKRSKYLRRLLNDYTRKFDDIILQTVCMGLEIVDKSTCGIDVGCTILRTKQKMPDTIELRSRDSIISIGPTIIGEKKFKVINPEQANSILEKPFSNSIYAFKNYDDYVYLISKNDTHRLINCINVVGLFENPQDLENFTNDCCTTCPTTETCFNDNSLYPLQGFLIDDIGKEIKSELSVRFDINEDKNNNSQDENSR